MIDGEGILILDILEILKKHTYVKDEENIQSDENYTLTQKEILEMLQKDDRYKNLQRKTVKTNIEKLIAHGSFIGYTESERIMKNRKTGEKESYPVYSNFYFKHQFSHEELLLIINSILFSKQVPSEQRKKIIEKLESLASKYLNSRKKYIRGEYNKHLKNDELLENIRVLDEAISENKKVKFNYSRYNVVKMGNKSQLVYEPQKNQEGEIREYVINPYQMVSTNGRYYIICNNDKLDTVSHYRVDRITNIEILNEKRKPEKNVKELKNGLTIQQYMAEHLYMFGGKSISVKLKCKAPIINEFVDWFGPDGIELLTQTEDEITFSVNVNEEAIRKWALQYALHIQVISPQSLVDLIKEDLKQALENYE